MHPAPSLILFTVASGFGFGFLAFLGLGIGLPATPGGAAAHFALAFAACVGGLAASTFHLGHPERALRAFTQWRTSWLSREAWLAVATLALFAAHAAAVVLTGARPAWLGALGAAFAVATVLATSMIYACLRTVPRWNHWTTPASFLALAAAGGAIPTGRPALTAALLVLAGAALLAHWRLGAARFAAAAPARASAVGLDTADPVRPFEPPHTSPNYVTREMVGTVGRKHAARLRPLALALAVVLPLALVLAAPGNGLVLIPALALHLAGAATARWLFYAEAEHVVSLYYR